ncbi:MAG: hypothetical protein GX075_06400 [Firmicutes bacterium]|nr:hypothetical protein [Bacillota bacterium]
MLRKRFNRTQFSGGVFYLLLAAVWVLVSLKMILLESQSAYLESGPLLQFKILLPAVVYGGRFLLFFKYRGRSAGPWLFPACLAAVVVSVCDKFAMIGNLFHGLLVVLDILIWAFLINDILELIYALFYYWRTLPKVNYAMVGEIWDQLRADLFRLGIWLTSLMGLTFYYLVGFFMVDAVVYSYLLLTPLLISGTALYWLTYSKIQAWVRSDLAEIDAELTARFDWKQVKDDPELPQLTKWLEYLLLIRNYLNLFQRPVFLIKSLLLYSGCSALILSLPYFFGRVIEV